MCTCNGAACGRAVARPENRGSVGGTVQAVVLVASGIVLAVWLATLAGSVTEHSNAEPNQAAGGWLALGAAVFLISCLVMNGGPLGFLGFKVLLVTMVGCPLIVGLCIPILEALHVQTGFFGHRAPEYGVFVTLGIPYLYLVWSVFSTREA